MESEAKFRSFVENAPDGIFLTDRDQNYQLVNPAACAMTGYTAEEFAHMNIRDLVPVEGMVEAKAVHDRVVEDGRVSLELRLRRKDGSIFWAALDAVKIDEDHLLAFCKDITERKQGEEALKESTAHLHTLVNTIPDLVWLKDPQGIYLACNLRFQKYFGAKEQEIIGKTDYDFVDEGLAKFFRETDRIAVTAGKPTSNEERVTFACDGHQEDLETIKTPIFDSDGRLSSILGIGRNITERKQAEQALLASEEKFSMVYHLSPDAIDLTHLETGVQVEANQSYLKMFGYTREELIGHSTLPGDLGIWVNKEDRERLIVSIKEHGEEREFETLLHRKDGSILNVHISSSLLEIRGERYNLSICRDISERKKAEEALREAYQLNEQVLHCAQEGIIVYGPDLHYQIWNPYMEKLSGTTASELKGRHPLEVYPFLREIGVMGRLELALAGVTVDPIDYPYQFPKTGKSGWGIDATAPLRNAKGEIIGVIRTIREVTERKQAEQALKESEYFFRESQRAAGIGSYKADLTNNTWKTSEFLEEIFGIDDSYPRNIQSWMDLIHPTDKAMMDRYLKEEVIAGRKPFSKEYRIIHKKDNETKWVNGLGEIKLDNNILSLIGTIQDITERKKTEEEKAKLEAQLQQAQKMESLGILVAGVAHNINNVLAIIMGTASFREQSVIEPSDLKAYKTIGNACKRGRDVVRSLMQFARPSFSNQAPIELHALIKEVCILLENTTSNRIKIIQTFSKEPSWISGDAGTINHALLNLCLNSVDAMPNGGTLSLRTTIPENEWVEVSVEDNGTGIAPEVLVQVMEPFYTTKGMGKGTGLGLSMTYGVIKAHGGSIDIASQPGQGTIVKLRFPRIPAPVESEPEFANAPAPSLGSMKVFLVDDDEDIRLLMTRMLKKAGVGAVETAASGEEALEKLLSGELPDVLILDQNMPGMRGDQLMARVRDRYSDLPILFSSGQPDIESWAILNQPKVALISKPFTMDEIQAKLAQFAHEIIPKG